MFQKMYVDQPDNWQPIEEAQVRQELASYYRNVGEVIDCVQEGGKARTPWAFYRWELETHCDGAYVDYFRRGLITANEWARLESCSLTTDVGLAGAASVPLPWGARLLSIPAGIATGCKTLLRSKKSAAAGISIENNQC